VSVLARGIGIVVLAYSANALFNHTAVGLGLKSHEGAYVLGFFLPFGVVLPAVFLGRVTTVGLAPARWLGVQLGWRDLWATAAALAAAALVATAPLAPVLREPGGMTAVRRLFALLLVASTAEVLIFLGVLGTAVQLAAGGRSRWRSGLIALVTSSLAFGFFHLTYPAPWNTIAKCLGLSVVWAGVSLVFLLSRSLIAAIAFNNVMAVVGFAQGGIALSGTPAAGWLQAIVAILVFTLVFSKALTVGRPVADRRGGM
jgi:hypothetical protein